MTSNRAHVTVCICTFKRPHLLARLLAELGQQQTEGLFGYSIVVADNDKLESARDSVAQFAAAGRIETTYCVEPEQNIALARNRALENARGDWLAFIDDDEFPGPNWLLTLMRTCLQFDADGVLGPVNPHFEHAPPAWVRHGRLFDRPTHETGFVIRWQEARTGNVLIKRSALDGLGVPFKSEFGSGSEDQDFFRRLAELERKFIWCHEAFVYETVPPIRWRRSFMLRKALLRGKNSFKNPAQRWPGVAKALVAIPIYALALPFLLLAGHHWFMKYLVKLFDHAGRILALLGFNPGGNRYLTE